MIGAVTGAAKRAAALEAGAQEVVDLADEGWKDSVKALAGSRGVDVVFDPVGGSLMDTARIAARFPLERHAEAFATAQDRRTLGRVLLLP